MAERVIVHQNHHFETWLEATDPNHPESDELRQVHHALELSPYTMLLSSVGTCTAIVLHKYAINHHVHLDAVEIRLSFGRHYDEDCENCEEIKSIEEDIAEEILLMGDLTPEQKDKLLHIARHCPIDRMIHQGVEVHSRLVTEA